MRRFLGSLLKEYTSLDLGEVEEHKKWIVSLIQYHDKEGNLDSSGVEIENLQYLKAAALSQILDLENKRKGEKRPTVIKALTKEIYYIVSQLRRDPFLEIKLPDFMHDLIAG